MSKKGESSQLLQEFPDFTDTMHSLVAMERIPAGVVEECREAVAMARRFNRTVARSYALELDRRMQEDPTFLPWELVEEANRWGFFTMWIPKLFGGKGWSLSSISPFVEELASECLAITNLIGVHYFGYSILVATWNIRLIDMISREVVEGEREGRPCLVSGAVTEPEAGTDAEEVELLARARVRCHARRVEGGYVVNGRKIFISNGHLSTWHILIACEDLERPDETMIAFAVKNGMPGFFFGRMEKKMGQKGCPASELVFEDCFIPDENLLVAASQLTGMKRGARELGMQLIDFVVSATRPGVGAMGAGVARGAFELALRFARETEVAGKPLINHEWAQCLLAEMYKNAALARLSYMEANYSNSMYGMAKLLSFKPLYYYNRLIPTSMFDRWMPAANSRQATTAVFRKLVMDGQSDAEARRASGWASLAKVAGTDLGVRNCQLALELMGQAGLRHDRRAEKCLRDAKLLQIYEGTNQLNRLNVFKCLVAPAAPEARAFED
ncbi:acyl-CoA dehydrogenase family protein [Candidatus Solincola tengchongensis]|uniref:acyl-CoA dehydrogenase family protein n=1 Tax=Candidatus Solincola tengchongensis TaxID=2900693 RepID=UPI00257CE1FB|nr:acyl-CoA dehydrogenase family protein [Candidatus Solincola tengchongensis]